MCWPQTTDADGKYYFGNLREGAYVVNIVPPTGYLPTIGGNDPNDDDAADSNGILNPDGVSPASRLTSNGVKSQRMVVQPIPRLVSV